MPVVVLHKVKGQGAQRALEKVASGSFKRSLLRATALPGVLRASGWAPPPLQLQLVLNQLNSTSNFLGIFMLCGVIVCFSESSGSVKSGRGRAHHAGSCSDASGSSHR